jgi:Protein of unknown function (DUF1812).
MKMERLYKFTYSLLVVVLLSIAFNSCIKDDLSDCPSSIRIYFDYLPATYANIKEGINPDEVTRMNLYWFDAETDLFLGVEVDEAPELGLSDYFMTIPTLKTGEYKFVAWGNLEDEYSLLPEEPVVGSTTFDRFTVTLNTVVNDSVKNKISPLFFGKSEPKKIQLGELAPEVTIPIVQDTYTINLTVDGKLDTGGNYHYVISDSNTFFDFNNAYVPSTTVHYMTDCGKPQNGKLNGSLTTLRIGKGRNPILKVLDTRDEADPVFSINLVDLILDLETLHKVEIDFDHMYEFDINVTIDNGSFIVVVNGWQLVYREQELFG